MRHGLFVPPFGPLSEPAALLDLAVAADESGFDGLFLWDHVLRRPGESPDVADPFVLLAAAAVVTSRLRLGTMVTPLVRRRPQVLARQVVTLDRLSNGRAVLGLGLGVDTAGELSRFGEVTDEAERGALLDEGADLLAALFTGEVVRHVGPHFVADDVAFLPVAVQRPRVPMWFAARGLARRPVRRAARFDGLFVIDVDDDALALAIELARDERGSLDGFDVATTLAPDGDPARLERRGVTWAMWAFRPGDPLEQLTAFAAAGPPA